MMNKPSARYIVAVFCSLLLQGCALVSGGAPLAVSANDKLLVAQARMLVREDVPYIRSGPGNRAVMEYAVAFDGTMNDRTRVPVGESETIVASIAGRTGAVYYPGPGMQDPHHQNYLDGMFGYTSPVIARTASDRFLAVAKRWIVDHPDGEMRVFVTGFSRGAAIARDFMNAVQAASEQQLALRGRVYFYAILFDTVSTGQSDTLELSLPASVDYLVHFIAIDEPRFLYHPVLDTPPAIETKLFYVNGQRVPARIRTIFLPGAHADIGGSYNPGIAIVYRQLTEELLYQMGLIEQNCWKINNYARGGKHDSRGWIDRWFGIAQPNSAASVARTLIARAWQNPTEVRVQENATRQQAMIAENSERWMAMQVIESDTVLHQITLRKNGQGVSVVDWQPHEYIDGASFRYTDAGNVRRLSYRNLPPYQDKETSVVLDDAVWQRLDGERPVVLSYSPLTENGHDRLTTFVDDIDVGKQPARGSWATMAVNPDTRCE